MKTTLLFLSVFLSVSLFAQNVNIPDATFKGYLVGNSQINTNSDTEIQVSEATVFNGEIDCSALSISDLTGIEAFVSLTQLKCGQNYNIISIDVSQNTALTTLSCGYNQLTSLDVSQNTALTSLKCMHNYLTSLDVSNNSNLTKLEIDENYLTSLDVSNNTNLTLLNCRYNQLICLNIKNGNNTNMSNVYTDDNPNLTCIEVDDPAYSSANWISGNNPLTTWSTNCNYTSGCFTASLNQLTNSSKNLIQILDMMGRETTFKSNTPLIYVYDDGSTEKVFSVEY
jgi:hypothetical protein